MRAGNHFWLSENVSPLPRVSESASKRKCATGSPIRRCRSGAVQELRRFAREEEFRSDVHTFRHVPVFENHVARADPASLKPFWRRDRLIWALLALIALFAGVEGLRFWRGPSNVGSGREMRLDITTPPTTDPVSLAISPDGQKIVFVAASQGHTQLWLRPSKPLCLCVFVFNHKDTKAQTFALARVSRF